MNPSTNGRIRTIDEINLRDFHSTQNLANMRIYVCCAYGSHSGCFRIHESFQSHLTGYDDATYFRHFGFDFSSS